MTATRSGPGRPAQISRERILDAAMSAGNLDTLTMRDLAARLDVTHGALYRWVRNRDELFDLISDLLVDRVLPEDAPTARTWRAWLARLGWAMHDHFLAVPGYASHLSRPHRHHAESFHRLKTAIAGAFALAGTEPEPTEGTGPEGAEFAELAEQSYYIFLTSLVSWLAVQEAPLALGEHAPRFELFLDSLLRGLPAREPGVSK